MCLKFGTPERLREVVVHGAHYPEHCEDEATLKGFLEDEMVRGCYDNRDYYAPHFAHLLRVLVERYDRIEPKRREPYYPYCDLIQGLAFPFGIFGTMSKWYPVQMQDMIALHGLGLTAEGRSIIGSTCYTTARAIWRAADEDFQRETLPLYERWEQLGGMGNLLSEYAFSNSDILNITPYREVRHEHDA